MLTVQTTATPDIALTIQFTIYQFFQVDLESHTIHIEGYNMLYHIPDKRLKENVLKVHSQKTYVV